MSGALRKFCVSLEANILEPPMWNVAPGVPMPRFVFAPSSHGRVGLVSVGSASRICRVIDLSSFALSRALWQFS